MPALKKMHAWKGLFYIFRRLKAWQITVFRDLALMAGETIIWVVSWVAPRAGKPLRIPEDVPVKHRGVSFSWSSCHFTGRVRGVPFGNIYEAIILNTTRHICAVPGSGSLGEVERSPAKLITYQWLFRNGSEWKPFVMGNPFFDWIYASAVLLRAQNHPLVKPGALSEARWGRWILAPYWFPLIT